MVDKKNKKRQLEESEVVRLKGSREGRSSTRIAFRAISVAARSGGISNRWTKAKGHSKVTINNFHQRAVVKNRITRNKGGKASKQFRQSLGKHLSYIERESAQKEKTKGEMYDQERDGLDKKEFLDKAEKDPRSFRLILSPENVNNNGKSLDMKEYTREFMARVQDDLGTNVDWIAVNHFNTEHPHSHIVMRGVDKGGDELIIKPEYLQHGMREQAQAVATSKLGTRSYSQIQEQMQADVSKERVTGYDHELKRMMGEGTKIDLRLNNSNSLPFKHQLLLGRAQFLEQLGLAKKDISGLPIWEVEETYLEKLKARGQRNDVYKHLEKTNSHDIHIYSPKEHGKIHGHVVDTGIHDELKDSVFHVIAGHDGNAYYVRGHRYGLNMPDAKTGDCVTLDSHYESIVKPRADENILRVTNGGKIEYSKEAHREDYEGYYRYKNELGSEPLRGEHYEDIERHVLAHERRLERLERHGIVERTETGNYRVPTDLQKKVNVLDEKLKADSVRFPYVFHQSSNPILKSSENLAPHWLDNVLEQHNGIPSANRIGFGSTFYKASDKRLAFLQSHGLINNKDGKLAVDHERLKTHGLESFAKDFKQKHGFEPDHKSTRSMSGRITETVRVGDKEYALVRNQNSAALVPKSQYMKPGQDVHIKNIKLAQSQHHQIKIKPKGRSLDLGLGM
jgi:type IV secretory pathway VirD2 relaxase